MMEAVKGKIDNCLCRKEPKMKSGFTAADRNCAPARVLSCSSCLGEVVSFDSAHKWFL